MTPRVCVLVLLLELLYRRRQAEVLVDVEVEGDQAGVAWFDKVGEGRAQFLDALELGVVGRVGRNEDEGVRVLRAAKARARW
jgi:hypothetical protein